MKPRYKSRLSHLGERLAAIAAVPDSADAVIASSLLPERRRSETAKQEDEERLRSEFTSMVSHELRAPLAAIKQVIENLQRGVEGELTPSQFTRLEMARSNVARLERLTGDLLHFTRFEAGRMPMRYAKVDLPALVADVASALRQEVEAKGLLLSTEIVAGVPPLLADADRLRQVLINLIDNALKCTGPGGRIALRLSTDAEGVRIGVEDTGEGIAEEDLPRIFEPFLQLCSQGGVPNRGSGLGLAICRQIVRAHGGRIDVSSMPGCGSVFSVWLPPAPPASS